MRPAWLALVAACSTGGGTAIDGGPPPIDAVVPDGADTFSLGGQIVDIGGVAVGGAQICMAGGVTSPCATTDSLGDYTIAIPGQPPDTSITEVVTATGFPTLQTLQTEEEPGEFIWSSTIPIYSDAEAAALLGSAAGFTFPDAAHGFLMMRVDATGATAAIASGGSGGTIVYTGSDGGPAPGSAATGAPNGTILFGGLPPGTYQIDVTAPGKTCTCSPDGELIAGDWLPTGSATVTAPVAAATITDYLTVTCN
jgi:hypothetical protein|nr:hypothetical protein [Kofleriaceae bacterium]